MRRKLLPLVLLLIAAGLVGVLLLRPGIDGRQTLTGYVEGEPLYLAAPVSGAVEQVFVQRGQEVAAGDPLFVVDPTQLAAQRDQAAAEVAAARAQAEDARQGQRPAELAVFDAQVAAAEARARDAAADLRRIRPLVEKGIYAPARLDDAEAAHQAALAEVKAAARRRDAAELGARQGQVEAADERVRQAEAALTAAGARLADLAPRAPAAARVEEVFYQPGEWAGANQPVVSLLPHDRVRLRFFVPETVLAAYRPGRTVRFGCDGCQDGLTAKIVFVSPRPEFTPPVIYSRESRERLVYMVEAIPSVRLNPGQPVDVVPLEAGS
ncbi:MAG: HlyD family efflux transporter periplasmic adaptor subunit [Phenylobacterium sp.]|jgi:HlyD family secretion protein|uniref:HlyD family secretion protein n=1 Tax=Phenylobacterium sp. TaxID=1871053 RepID=UPI002A371E3E|nr:HlyD family efflux transporter periplasmic adaptor subunit [Phenylobacterium sp.]MDX9999417.1 HlyD family efflux transporter periplasmic adaptor subunit [Phenylobacterium sp.]